MSREEILDQIDYANRRISEWSPEQRAMIRAIFEGSLNPTVPVPREPITNGGR